MDNGSISLLRETIRRLNLDPKAPYPSQLDTIEKEAFDVRQKILDWRVSQRVRLVRSSSCDRDGGMDRVDTEDTLGDETR